MHYRVLLRDIGDWRLICVAQDHGQGAARPDAERLICGDAELAADDVELARIYAKAKAAGPDQAAFKTRTREQWNCREQTCHDHECPACWYADQKVALSEIADGGASGR